GRLVIAQRLLRPASATSPRPPSLRTVLIAGVLDLRLRYFGVRDQEQAPQWHDSWRQADRLPQLIAIDVAFASKDQRQWLTLIAGPRLGPGRAGSRQSGVRVWTRSGRMTGDDPQIFVAPPHGSRGQAGVHRRRAAPVARLLGGFNQHRAQNESAATNDRRR